ncbi:hypothetical protein Fmac_027504 [Flemingia macrophylla]|uniref:Growth-regulating factor n=1 Tax=Flemingia macrophylla TaxID=520843 RepID=A0ABD1LHV4_9FABA
MGSGLSFAQLQELELQVLIFRHMQAGAPVPPHLLQPIKQSFLQHYHPPLAALDPELGRCRRTDGKKWRCSRDAVAGQKYCERHMHRGRNRSRKPVEPFLHLNQSSPGTKNENGNMFENLNHVDVEGKSDGHGLRHFFDDWPKPEKSESSDGRSNSGTCLSMGITSSDVSLKLSTGHGEGTCHLASVGGPLAEALRSSTSISTSSPTSVLLQLPPNSACETSFIGT